MKKNNLKDVKDAVFNDLKNAKIESGKESTQRIAGSILKKYNVDFDEILQNTDYLSIYKNSDTIANISISNETSLITNDFGENTKIKYDTFNGLEIL